MTAYKPYLVFLGIVVVALVLLSFVSLGFYPIVWVAGDFVSARHFYKHYGAATLYYQNALRTYNVLSSSSTQLTPTEIQASVLDQLIENTLVARGVREEVGEDAEALAQNRLEKFDQGQTVKAAVHTLYGLGFEEFEHEILLPQAQFELLSGRLFLRGKKIDDWLLETKRSSRVIIFSNRFSWDGEQVRINDEE